MQECLLFDVEKCKVCPLQEFLRRGKSKTYSVAIKSEEHLDQQAFQETEEFKRLTRERYKIEEKIVSESINTGTIEHRLWVYLACKFRKQRRYSLSI